MERRVRGRRGMEGGENRLEKALKKGGLHVLCTVYLQFKLYSTLSICKDKT
jgi:hypothetical protein